MPQTRRVPHHHVRTDEDVNLTHVPLTWSEEGVIDARTGRPIAGALRPNAQQVEYRNGNPLDLRRANLRTPNDRTLIRLSTPSGTLTSSAEYITPILTLLAREHPDAPITIEVARNLGSVRTLHALVTLIKENTLGLPVTPTLILRAVLHFLSSPEPITPTQAVQSALPRRLPAARFDWNSINWDQSDTEIARSVGAARSTVHKARQRHQTERHATRSTSSGFDWSKVNWSETDARLAKQLGRARGTVYNQRKRHAPHTIRNNTAKAEAPAHDSDPIEELLLELIRSRAAINERILTRRTQDQHPHATQEQVQNTLSKLNKRRVIERHPEHPRLWRMHRE